MLIGPHEILKIISDMAKKGYDPVMIAEAYKRLTGGIEMPLDVQQEALRIMAGQVHLEKIIFKENVRKLVLSVTGIIDVREVMAFFDARGDQKWIIYQTMQQMESEGLIIRTGNRHGVYRIVDRDSHIMDLDAVDEKVADIYLPLLLHTMVELYPKNIILISGEKDAGKTCFSLNVAFENRDRYHVRYFNSEMGEMELRRRLMKFPQGRYKIAEWKKITWYEQAKNFEDHIDPNGLNIIDFLEVGAEAYTVTEDIRRVFDKLDKGLLLIVMQKRSYKEYGVGGEGTLEKARLAINLEHKEKENIARITVAKNWRTSERSRGKICKYKIVQGGEMQMDGSWHYPEQAEAAGAKASPKGFTKRSANVYNLGTADPGFPREI